MYSHTHTAVVCYRNWAWPLPIVTNYLPVIKEIEVFLTAKAAHGDWRDFWETGLYYGSLLSLSLNCGSALALKPYPLQNSGVHDSLVSQALIPLMSSLAVSPDPTILISNPSIRFFSNPMPDGWWLLFILHRQFDCIFSNQPQAVTKQFFRFYGLLVNLFQKHTCGFYHLAIFQWEKSISYHTYSF